MALKLETTKPGVDYATHLTPKTVTKPITGYQTTAKKIGNEPEAQEVTETQTIHKGIITDGHVIRVAGSRTLNLGNFESARIEVGIEVPTSKDELEDAYEFATTWVSDKIDSAVKLAKS